MIQYPLLYFGTVESVPSKGNTFDLREFTLKDIRKLLSDLLVAGQAQTVVFWHFDSIKQQDQAVFLKFLEDSIHKVVLCCFGDGPVLPTIYSRCFIKRDSVPKSYPLDVDKSVDELVDMAESVSPVSLFRALRQKAQGRGLEVLLLSSSSRFLTPRQKRAIFFSALVGK